MVISGFWYWHTPRTRTWCVARGVPRTSTHTDCRHGDWRPAGPSCGNRGGAGSGVPLLPVGVCHRSRESPQAFCGSWARMAGPGAWAGERVRSSSAMLRQPCSGASHRPPLGTVRRGPRGRRSCRIPNRRRLTLFHVLPSGEDTLAGSFHRSATGGRLLTRPTTAPRLRIL